MSIVVRRLTEDLVLDLILSPPVPHRHAFQEVVLLTEGGGTHEIDGELHAVAAPMAMLRAPLSS